MKSYKLNEVTSFRKTKDTYGGLSNMCAGYPLEINGVTIRTSEALYQACRFPNSPHIQEKIINQKSPMAAKMVGKPHRQDNNRVDWEDVRVDIMRWCLEVKLEQNMDTFGKLLKSTESNIVELSHKDQFWGTTVDKLDSNVFVGENTLGVLLQELKEKLIQEGESFKTIKPNISTFKLYGKEIE